MSKPIYRDDYSRYISDLERRISNLERADYQDAISPAPHVSLSKTSQSILNSTNTALVWQTILYDNTDTFTSGDSEFVITEPGLYYVVCNLVWDLGAAAGNVGGSLILNGTDTLCGENFGDTGVSVQNFSIMTRLVTGDTLEISVFHDSGATEEIETLFDNVPRFVISKISD